MNIFKLLRHSDLYFEIVMNMKNHESRVSVCFHAKSSKYSIHSIILEKRRERMVIYIIVV